MKYKTGCRELDWRIPFNIRSVPDEDLIYQILAVVEEIPEGRVATYGQIARLIGRERNARLVGKVLSMAEHYGEYPCHRVVNCKGRIAPRFAGQKARIEAEHIVMKDERHVDLRRFQWDM